MRKTHRIFGDLPVGALFLVEEHNPEVTTVWEKRNQHDAHKLEMPEFNRAGGPWTFPLDGVVIELVSEFTGESPTRRR